LIKKLAYAWLLIVGVQLLIYASLPGVHHKDLLEGIGGAMLGMLSPIIFWGSEK
jgi:hypothetical protein